MILSFDVGGTNIKYGIIDSGIIIKRGLIETNIKSKEDLIETIKKVLLEFKEEYIELITFSFPGFVSDEGQLIKAGALVELDGLKFKEFVESKLPYQVFIENDAKCAAIAEHYSGNAVGKKNIVVMTIGTGIGGGIILNNQLLKGSAYTAGEFGSMMIDNKSKAYPRLHDNASTSSLLKQYNETFNVNIKNAKTIFDNYKDEQVREILDQWIKNIALSIFNLTCTLNPEIFLLGGGISANPLFIEMVKNELKKNPYWEDYKCEVDSCYYLNDAGMIGAYYNAKKGVE